MQRRAEFARVALTRPDLLLLDEAHAGLDPQAADLVAHLVAGVRARDGAAIVVSHEHARIAPLVDRFVELHGGALTDAEWSHS
jgi:heme exporter protein A